jgi:hypothetical protein
MDNITDVLRLLHLGNPGARVPLHINPRVLSGLRMDAMADMWAARPLQPTRLPSCPSAIVMIGRKQDMGELVGGHVQGEPVMAMGGGGLQSLVGQVAMSKYHLCDTQVVLACTG